MTVVVNLRHEKADVVIDRRSRWGNPFRIGTVLRSVSQPDISFPLDRLGAVGAYGYWLAERLVIEPDFLEPLRGKRLGCWCKPLPCHGDVIVELLEAA